MEIVTWRGFASLARLALIGVGVAFAGALVCLLLGLGGASAHADDGEEPGLLGAVTGLVDEATSLVGSTVTEVASTATDAVSAVVAVAPAPVRQPVQDVVQTAGEVVTAVAEPVREAAPEGIVTTVTQPVLNIVTEVPLVGEVVTTLGVDDAVGELGSSVDGLLDTTLEAVTDTTAAIGAPETVITTPDPAAGSSIPPVFGWAPAAAPAAVAPAAARGSSSVVAAAPGTPSFAAPAASARIFASVPPAGAPPGALCLSALAGSASGGSGSGAWALAALLPFAAHRAWVRRPGSPSDDAPAAPFFDTDVSPD